MSISLFILSSCEKELYEDAIKEKENISRVSINDIPFLKKTIDTKKTNRTSDDDLVFFLDKINTENIIQIIDQNGIKNFTFALNYRDQDTLYNLCAKETLNEDYSFKLVKYNSSNLDQWIEDIKNNVHSQINPDVSIDDFSSKSTVYCVKIEFTCPSGQHSIGDVTDCIFNLATWSTSYEYYPCNVGGSGNENNNSENGSNSNNNGGGSNGGGNTSNSTSVLTAPNVVVVTTPSINYISNLGLKPLENVFLNDHDIIENEIQNYLNSNHLLSDYSFINNVIDQIMLNPTLFTSITPFLIEKKIDDSELDDCTKGILNAIRNSQNNDIATIIAKLDNSPSTYNTKIVSTNVGSIYTTLARTNWTGKFMMPANTGTHTPFDYKIGLHSTMVNQGTTVQIYATLLHELIHAYFLSIIDDCIVDSNSCQPLQDLPYLWNHYVNYKNGFAQAVTSNISQHNQLATSYVDIIITALQEFQPGLSQQLYNDLAWGGLNGTIPYENNDPLTRKLTDEDRERIPKVNEAEALNTTLTNPSGVATYFPQGTPCD